MSSLPNDADVTPTVNDTNTPTAAAAARAVHLPTADDANDIAPGLVTLRRALHENVEVGLDLLVTQKLVLDAIEGLDVEVTTGEGLSSIVVVLRGGARKEDSTGVVPAVLLRGDMDGLPVTEATGFDFAATSGGCTPAATTFTPPGSSAHSNSSTATATPARRRRVHVPTR